MDSVRAGAKHCVRLAATATAPLRPLPDLIVVGVKRGGTTSLFRDLERHPAMLPLVPSARWLPLRDNQKGVHYFDDHIVGDSTVARSTAWYRGHFASTPTRWLRRQREGAAFTAEASPYTIFHPLGAERVARLVAPPTQFVVMLRDPVERTISHWAEQTRNGVETLSLGAALAAESERVGGAAHALTTGTIRHSFAHEQQSYAAQSRYATSLRRWFDVVGSDRTLVLFSEDYYAHPQHTLGCITERLGVPPVPAAPDDTHANAAARPGNIDPALEAQLVQLFADDVDEVEEIIGRTPPWPRWRRSR